MSVMRWGLATVLTLVGGPVLWFFLMYCFEPLYVPYNGPLGEITALTAATTISGAIVALVASVVAPYRKRTVALSAPIVVFGSILTSLGILRFVEQWDRGLIEWYAGIIYLLPLIAIYGILWVSGWAGNCVRMALERRFSGAANVATGSGPIGD